MEHSISASFGHVWYSAVEGWLSQDQRVWVVLTCSLGFLGANERRRTTIHRYFSHDEILLIPSPLTFLALPLGMVEVDKPLDVWVHLSCWPYRWLVLALRNEVIESLGSEPVWLERLSQTHGFIPTLYLRCPHPLLGLCHLLAMLLLQWEELCPWHSFLHLLVILLFLAETSESILNVVISFRVPIGFFRAFENLFNLQVSCIVNVFFSRPVLSQLQLAVPYQFISLDTISLILFLKFKLLLHFLP